MAEELRKDTLEAIARSEEAKAHLLRGRAGQDRGTALAKVAQAAAEAALKAQENADAVQEPKRNLSGVTQVLSDESGAFPSDVAQAQEGGIGVVDSNSKAKPAPALSGDEKKAAEAKIKDQKGK